LINLSAKYNATSVSELSKDVAVQHRKFNITVEDNIMIKRKCQGIMSEDDLSISLSKWNPEPTGGQNKRLNEDQRQAMDKALTRKFWLIQGPPGTHTIIIDRCFALASLIGGE
jgi:primosomal protein N'